MAKFTSKKLQTAGLMGASALAGLVVGLFVPFSGATSPSAPFLEDVREFATSYRLVSPLLSCPEVEIDHLGNSEINELEDILTSEIDAKKKEGVVMNMAVYFRQLKGGPWLGIGHDTKFYPRSLLKVPLAMALYKKAEGDPALLNAAVDYVSGAMPSQQHFGKDKVVPGKEYSLKELLDAALIDSDNNAALLITEVIGTEALQGTYQDLGIEVPYDNRSYTTTVRNYASFFRILYNATYLTPEASEHILEILSRASFVKGLRAGVPDPVVVAHKFGEQSLGEKYLQLHDCGVVYHPTKPYLLCVMTEGTDFEILADAIAEVSRTTYDFIAR